MAPKIDALLTRIQDLQQQMEEEWDTRRSELRYRLDRGRVVFDDEVRQRHRAARVRLGRFLAATRPMVVLTTPLIYGLVVPLALLDLAVTLYQRICFPIYGIPPVRRRDYMVIDRQHLAYLNGLQKLNCVYCGYAGGMIAYAREVASRTEAYWCPIKHASRVRDAHGRYPGFMEFGEPEDLDAHWDESRRNLRD